MEDHDDTRVVFELMLRHAGFEVTSVPTAEECVELAKSGRYDAILMDHVEPGSSDAKHCLAVREFDKDVPILFFSAQAFPNEKEAAFRSGASDYLVKPNDVDNLTDRVWKFVNERRARIRADG